MLDERDARRLVERVTERLYALGARPASLGVHLTREGLSFTAGLHGRMVTVRTAEGTVRYADVARDLLLLALDPGVPWCDRIDELREADGRRLSTPAPQEV